MPRADQMHHRGRDQGLGKDGQPVSLEGKVLTGFRRLAGQFRRHAFRKIHALQTRRCGPHVQDGLLPWRQDRDQGRTFLLRVQGQQLCEQSPLLRREALQEHRDRSAADHARLGRSG